MRFILYPFAFLFGVVVSFRNYLYDVGILKSYKSTLKSIGIGNLQVGGSGKTPMTAYLYQLLKDTETIAILSRGYGRVTKGLIEADDQSTPSTIGDEPMWYHKNLKEAKVVVSEKRLAGLKLLEKTDVTLVLMDDVFQHRAVEPDIQILLTEYRKPYYKDYLMPVGRLRESRHYADRADFVVVTKCPQNLSKEERKSIAERIKAVPNELVMFTGLEYGTPYVLKGKINFEDSRHVKVIALSGLADPTDFIHQCRQFGEVQAVSFPDHYKFTRKDIEKVNALLSQNAVVICTEKDAVKLQDSSLSDLIINDKYFALPVKPKLLNFKDEELLSLLKDTLKMTQEIKRRSVNKK